MSKAADAIAEVFASANARGFLYAREVGVEDGPEVAVDGDSPVVLASVAKIVTLIAYARAASVGGIDPAERTTVTARDRIGGIGTAGSSDDVTMSWRDLARFMMTMSDNAATDVLYRRLGQPAIQRVIDDAGLRRTRVDGDCADLFRTMYFDLGLDLGSDDLLQQVVDASPEKTWQLSALDPERTIAASTPREVAQLLDALWTDRIAVPEACAVARSIMAEQIWEHRLTYGFDADVACAAKTGTLPSIRNEAGVVTYPDGRRFAVAVFTRAASLVGRQPAVDAAIGTAARIAVEELRSVAR